MRDAPQILVVDDDSELRAVIAVTLRRAGYQVVEAAGGVEALAALEARRASAGDAAPTVAIMDICMPGMSGIQVLASLWLRRENLRVVLMTAFPDRQAFAIAESLGAVMLLEKPFEMGDLHALVDALVCPPSEGAASAPK